MPGLWCRVCGASFRVPGLGCRFGVHLAQAGQQPEEAAAAAAALGAQRKPGQPQRSDLSSLRECAASAGNARGSAASPGGWAALGEGSEQP